jgi:hypothetical protein
MSLDVEHPWLGLESFSESTRAYFFGRDAEAAELLQRLRPHPLLVFYGRSGLGKTSLLRARLVPDLEKLGARPAFYRISYGEGEDSPLDQLAVALEANERISVPDVALPDDAASRLWLHIHRREHKNRITHLILDQFEEIFTLGADWPGADAEIRYAIAILVQGAIPPLVETLLDESETFLKHFRLDVPPLPVLLSLREDYVFALNRWRDRLPHLGQNHFELRALRGPAAFDAVFKPGCLRAHKRESNGTLVDAETGFPPIVSEATAQRIVRFIAEKKEDLPLEEIEAVPPILSLLCRELNERRYPQPSGAFGPPMAEIVFDEQDSNAETILETFYERCVAGRPEAVLICIEEDFVSHSGIIRLQNDKRSIIDIFANGYEIPGDEMARCASGYGDRDAAAACLRELVDERLLTPATGGENPRYELSHDLLCRVVHKRRTARKERLEKERLKALLSLKNNPAAGLALGYYGNFVRPVVRALLSEDVTIKEQDRGVSSIPEGLRIDNSDQECGGRSALKLFVIIPARFAIGESLTKIKRVLRHVTLQSSLLDRSLYVDALYSGRNYQLIDFSSAVSVIKLWAHREASQENLNPESEEALRIESDALESFERVLNWWIDDPANVPEFRQRVKVFRPISNISTLQALAEILGI